MALASFWWIVHPLCGRGYQFWSGIGSDFAYLGGLAFALGWLRHHNCHVHRCWRVSWHPHPEHGHPVCRRHYPAAKSLTKEDHE